MTLNKQTIYRIVIIYLASGQAAYLIHKILHLPTAWLSIPCFIGLLILESKSQPTPKH